MLTGQLEHKKYDSVKFDSNLHSVTVIFIQQNVFENVVCKMSTILSQPQCAMQRQTFKEKMQLKSKPLVNNFSEQHLVDLCAFPALFHTQVIFMLILVNGGWGISYEIALRRMPLDLSDDKSTLVQVMAWCRQATSHYLMLTQIDVTKWRH